MQIGSTKNQIIFSVLAQLVRFGAPVLFYPILIRTQTTSEFSMFVLSMAGGQAIGQFVEFGFGLSAVRELANRDQEPAASALASGEVLFGKLFMLLVTTVFYCVGSIAYSYYMKEHSSELWIPLLIGLAYGFTPNWFYIGVGRAHVLAVAEIAVSFVQLILVLALVRQHSSHYDAVLAMVTPVIALAIGGQIHAIRVLGLKTPSWRRMMVAIRTAMHFFVATNATSLTNRFMLLVLGANSTPIQVTFYAAGERLVTAGLNTMTPIMRVLIPKVAKLTAERPREARRLSDRVLYGGTAIYFLGATALAATAHFWVPLVFGSKLLTAGTVVGAFLFVIPISSFGRITGLLVLVPARREKLFHQITLAFCCLGLLLAYPLSVYGALAMVLVRLSVEAGIAVGCGMARAKLQSCPIHGEVKA